MRALWRNAVAAGDNQSMKHAVFALALLLPAVAHADAIDGPPACPPGSRGDAAHEGQWCEPWPCTSDAECGGGRCVPWRVCTRVASVVPGGRWAEPPPAQPRTLVVGTCDPSRACTGTEEPPPPTVGSFEGAPPPRCDEASYCVPVALPPFPGRASEPAQPSSARAPAEQASPAPATSSRNCGCRVAATSTRGSGLLVGVIALALRRRR